MKSSPHTYHSIAFDGSRKEFRQVDSLLAEPREQDLLGRVEAVSVNPVDLKVRQAISASDDTLHVLGWDAVGIVEKTGELVAQFKPGDRVWYAGQIDRPGSNAQYQLVDARLVSHAPGNLDDGEAAAMPLTLLTAWEALFDRLGYQWQPNNPVTERLLIVNGAGGVGSVAIQLARLAGIDVTATASREESQTWCRQLGASKVLPHAELANLDKDQFDRILCCHDTDRYFAEMARLVAPHGLICALSSTRQAHDLKPLMAKSAGFVWEYMFTPGLYKNQSMGRQQQILKMAAELMEQGRLRTTLTTQIDGLSPPNLERAHQWLAQGNLIGKLVIRL